MSDGKKETEKAPEFSVRDKRRVHLSDIPDEPGGGAQKARDDSKASAPADREPASSSAPDDAQAGPSPEQMRSAENMADAAASKHKSAPDVDFTTFVISLASSAVVNLGHAPHPDGSAPDVNLPMAKQVIDMLAMLKEKTKGNLAADEERYLEAILYDLRLRFVDATKPQASS